ncbi:translocation/assembly module TamB domain-containing protein [Herbaspirillum sp. RV1423]|uniref:translocation/assembly module TamB domain-containing protein n=1 Tax=Herbaspirillum sp. RV1423 TaxID=1443993 RepID=UPI0004B5922D|nr:translocation/assembly module TamB domain-containing protein [Herbaspirillum sp. RV1423]
MTATAATDLANDDLPPPRKPRHVGRWLLLGAAALLLALTAILAWMVGTESGTRSAWRAAVWAMQGKLSGAYVGGNLAEGVRLRNLRYRDATMQLDVDSIDAGWRLSPAQRRLRVAYLHVGTVDINKQPAPPEPTVLPSSLSLPLALDLNDISLQKLRLQQGTSVTELGPLQLHGTSDGVQHTLVLDKLNTAFGQATALLHLNGKRPFAIGGGVELAGAYQQEKIQLAAQLSGSLQELGVALTAGGDKLNGTADIVATPFATVPLKKADIDLQHINPQTFSSGAPKADLRLQANLEPVAGATADNLRVAGTVVLVNAIPGSIDQQRLPLTSAKATVDLGVDSQQLHDLRIVLLKNATLTGKGQFLPADKTGNFDFQVAALDLHTIHGQLKPTQLRGPLSVQLKPDVQNIVLNLQDARYNIQADAAITADKVTLNQVQLTTAGARLELAGTLGTVGAMDFAFKGKLGNFDPALWVHTGAVPANGKTKGGTTSAVSARINMDFDTSGSLSPELQAKLNFNIHDSSYDQLPMSGNGKLQLVGKRLLPSSLDLLLAGNQVQLKGAFGAPSDRLDVHIDAPQLARLGFGISGLLKLDGRLTGTMQRPNLRATYSGEQLTFGRHHLDKLGGQADIQTDLAAATFSSANKLQLSVDGAGYSGPDATLKQLKIALSGTYGSHQLSMQADGRVKNQTLALRLDAHGKVTEDKDGYGWNGMIDKLENQGVPRIALASPLSLALAADTLVAGTTRLNVDRMAIDLKSLSYRQGRIRSEGSAKALDVGRVLELVQELSGTPIPVKTDLVLDADWNFSLAETAGGFIQLARRSGDLSVNTGSSQVALGLSALQLRIDLAGQEAKFSGSAAASRIGTMEAQGQAGFLKQDGILALLPDSPLTAHARLNVPDIKTIGALLGPQYSLDGKLAMDLDAAGTLAKPRLSGAVNGDGLAVTLFDQGIQLKDGIVRIVMDDNVIDLRQIEFHGGEGTLRATGKVRLGDTDPDLNAAIVADRLQLFASPDRQLMLSGQARLANVNEQLRIDGKFTVDKALFDLPKSSAPKLGDDVVIVRKDKDGETRAKAGAAATSKEKLAAATEKPAGRFAPVMNIVVDLGNNFRFSGSGADLRLQGEMNVHSEPLMPLRAAGTLRVSEGTYEAFGTKLNIERGIINFQGPISNPNLNILAMRRNQDVEAGVEVTGNANQPRVRLVSEPNVPDDEKLSWMMFGHGTDSSGLGQRTASSQALAFVGNFGGKKIAKDIGLDQFSIGASESGLSDEQVVNLGKAISEKLSVGYEQSLTGAASIAKATWQLSRRWSVVARTGTINGLNVLYNLRFD